MCNQKCFWIVLCLFSCLWAKASQAQLKDNPGGFCQNITIDQIPVGNFQPPLQMPIGEMRVTQIYNTTHDEGYCQNNSQASVSSLACRGQLIYYGHDGLDIHPKGAAAGQQDVFSVQPGLVVASHWRYHIPGWGDSVIVATRANKYSEEIITFHYHHLHSAGTSKQTYLPTRKVNQCDQVTVGQILAKEGGTTGWPTHLHVSMKRWQNLKQLQEIIANQSHEFYGHGYTFGDNKLIANFADPEGYFFNYFKEFTWLQNQYPQWQWVQPYALFMRSQGWEFGLFDGNFGVDKGVKKREIAKWLKIALEIPSYSPHFATFEDMPFDDPDFVYIDTLLHQPLSIRIINALNTCSSFGQFYCPDKEINRAEALKMIVTAFYQNDFLQTYNNWVWKASAPIASALLSKFVDVPSSAWYAPYVYFAGQIGLTTTSGYFNPDAILTRGELAKWLYIAYQSRHKSTPTFCAIYSCLGKYYCDEAQKNCLPIPTCLPTETTPCSFGGGYIPPVGGADSSVSTQSDAGVQPDASVIAINQPDSTTIINPPLPDSSPACSCTNGLCCDGCNFRNSTTNCSSQTEYQCAGNNLGDDVQYRSRSRTCSGQSAACNGNENISNWQTYQNCTANQLCTNSSSSAPICLTQQPVCADQFFASPSGPSCYSNPSSSGSPTICLETQQIAGSNWQFRFCKQGSSFSQNFSYELQDQNHSSNYLASGSYPAGLACSPWQTLNFSYLTQNGSANGAGLRVIIKSPSNCASTACTYSSGIVTIYKNCL